MPDYTKPLGDAVRKARLKLGYTQTQVADRIDIDARTVLNIENYKGNPKMEVLFPLIRLLRIDPNEIFYPELKRETPAIQQLRLMVESCTEEDARDIIPLVESVLTLIHNKDSFGV